MVNRPGEADAIEHSTYLRISGEAAFRESITADGDYEISFGRVATVALSPDAAEKLCSMLGKRVPELRKTAAATEFPWIKAEPSD